MSWGNLIDVEHDPVLVAKRMLHDRIGSERPDIVSTHGPLGVLELRRTFRCRLPDSVPQHGASTLGQQNQAHRQDQGSRKGGTGASSRSFLREATAKRATLYRALGIIWQSGVSVKINASTTRIKPATELSTSFALASKGSCTWLSSLVSLACPSGLVVIQGGIPTLRLMRRSSYLIVN